MKKVLLTLTLALTLGVTTSFAQKVNVANLTAAMEDATEDTNHAKKGLKASSWLTRAAAYSNALYEPTKALYIGMDLMSMKMLCGEPRELGEQTLGGKSYMAYDYPFFTAYQQDGKIVAWKIKKDVAADLEVIATESYDKAFSLDPNTKAKAYAGIDALVNYYKLLGTVALELNDTKGAVEAYTKVSTLQEAAAYDAVDPLILFYSGYLMTIYGDTDSSAYAKGEAILNRALEAGYCEIEDADTGFDDSERGNLYYYLFHCAYAMRESDPQKLEDAKNSLLTGITKYPKNEKIFEGLLQLYTSEDGVGDPKELLETIQTQIDANKDNVNAWFGRGRIYFALKDYKECINSFKEVVRIEPTAYDGNYYLGLFYMLDADDYLATINATTYTDRTKYNEDLATLTQMYLLSVPYFEAAHVANPEDRNALEYLKQLCFRLRDEPGIMEKYTKYNELFQAL